MIAALKREVAALIDRLAGGGRDDVARDALLRRALAIQATRVEPYQRFLASQTPAGSLTDPLGLPALPTDVFRHARVAAHGEDEDVRRFLTSGTSDRARGLHAMRDLDLYDRAARAAARYSLFPDRERMRLVILAPREAERPDSSLSYMLARFVDWFAVDVTYAWADGALLDDRIAEVAEAAMRSDEPIALLGTSFAFVHAEDALGPRRFALPAGSRIMQTGGFKGRSREIAPPAMRELLCTRYGVPEPWIVAEYGMTELSSQLYETTLRDRVHAAPPAPRRLWFPGWVRVTVVDPESQRELPAGQIGLVRIDDLANIDSICAIQTADLGRTVEDGIELLGRAVDAPARGCGLAVDTELGARS